MSDLITLPRAVFRKWRNALMEVWVTANTGSRLEIEHILAALDAALAQQAEPVQRPSCEDLGYVALSEDGRSVFIDGIGLVPLAHQAEPVACNEQITVEELAAALGWPGGISSPVQDKAELLRMVAQARVAQQAEPMREWQGLTDDDFPAIRDGDTAFRSGALWADRLLKEKNHG
jgi:hypothetical protein